MNEVVMIQSKDNEKHRRYGRVITERPVGLLIAPVEIKKAWPGFQANLISV